MQVTYTVQQLEAMTDEQLKEVVAGMCLNTNGNRRFLIENLTTPCAKATGIPW